MRNEANILKALLDGNIGRDKASQKLGKILKKYALDGSRKAIEACFFKIKNKISAISGKIKRYKTAIKAKEQNELFMKDKKKFFRSIFEAG